MIVVDKSLAPFIKPEINSFLSDLEAALLEHAEGHPLQIVAEYITEEDMSDATPQEILAALNVSYEAMLVIQASAERDKANPNYSSDLHLRIANIMMREE
jgi:hypothetical protein